MRTPEEWQAAEDAIVAEIEASDLWQRFLQSCADLREAIAEASDEDRAEILVAIRGTPGERLVVG